MNKGLRAPWLEAWILSYALLPSPSLPHPLPGSRVPSGPFSRSGLGFGEWRRSLGLFPDDYSTHCFLQEAEDST